MRRVLFFAVSAALILAVLLFGPGKSAAAGDEDAIGRMLDTWREAWQDKDIDAFMSVYRRRFSSEGLDYEGWKAKKTRLFKKAGAISVDISDVQIAVDGDRATVRFKQRYQASNYSDFGRKTLTLTKFNGKWKILTESFTGLPEAEENPEKQESAPPEEAGAGTPADLPAAGPVEAKPAEIRPPGGAEAEALKNIETVLIPGGSFLMGTDGPDARPDEKPVHRVTIASFRMDRYEVTVGQFRNFCSATGRDFPEQPGWSRDDHPVVNVTWDDANAYCEWLGRRLPTEAEWEYAARGGVEGRVYPWGDAFDCRMCNARGSECDGYEHTAPAGRFPPNGYGLYDVAGNVWEWCRDWFGADYYAASPAANPAGPDSGEYRVVRGGSFYFNIEAYYRSANRHNSNPAFRYIDLGFRCAGNE
jgi:sulfatase modifying factor 1